MAKQFDYQAILDTFQQLQQQANDANEQRYQQILQTIGNTQEQVGGTYDSVESLIQNLGNTQAGRIEQGRVKSLATNEQDLINRGLGNTTIRTSTQRGVNEDATRLQQENTDSVAQQKANVEIQRAGSQERLGNYLASMMNARTDQGPDLNAYTNLLNMAGQAEGAGTSSTLFTGLSANARAGLSATGQPFKYGGSGSGGGGSSGGGGGSSYGASGGGGGSSGGAYIVRNGSAGGSTYTAAANQAAGNLATQIFGGGSNDLGVGQSGSAFDNMFLGQPVYAGGNTLGTYTGGQTVSADRELLDVFGNLDPSRASPDQGGTGPAAGDSNLPYCDELAWPASEFAKCRHR